MLNSSVTGYPATFATAREKAWKSDLRSQLCAPAMAGAERGVALHFNVLALAPNNQPLDVDNLCEPVFSVLVGRLGWFGSSRGNVWWWSASKREGGPHGCAISISDARSAQLPSDPPALQGVYRGILPRNARAPEVAAWASRLVSGATEIPSRCIVHLAFGSSTVNIANISTGVVKSFVDCLYPILGGRAGAPEDYRVSQLIVEKGAAGLAPDEVRARFWFEGVREASLAWNAVPVTSAPITKECSTMTNPCRPGSAKWTVAQGAIEQKSESQVRAELRALSPRYEHRMKEYIGDLWSENRFRVRIVAGRLSTDR